MSLSRLEQLKENTNKARGGTVYEIGNISTPSDAQLKSWGISRDQYRSLFGVAKTDFISSGGKKLGTDITNEVNKYLKSKMVETKGAYGKTILGLNNSTPDYGTVIKSNSVSSSSGGGGGGGSSVVNSEPLTYYTADDLAKRFGIVNDYATILQELQGATTKKFDEMDATLKRAESSNLRTQEANYNTYLQDLRNRAANAVSAGATKGTMSANALASLLGYQENNREGINTLNTLIQDTALQKGTALATDVTTARQQANEIGQYLGNLATSMDTNAINKYAAELAANAQTRAASIQAGATTSAARMSANSAYDQLLNAFYNNNLNKGYSAGQANALKYTDYVNYLDRQYPAK